LFRRDPQRSFKVAASCSSNAIHGWYGVWYIPLRQPTEPGGYGMHTDTATRNGAVPALVLGSGVTALGVIRLLGRSGIPVYSLSDRRDFAATSRFCRGAVHVDPPAGIASLTSALEGLPFERALLFPCSDTWVDAVSALDGHLALRFPSTVAQDNVRL